MGSFFEKGAGGDAANLAIQELQKQFAQTDADVRPFIEAGQSALPRVESGSTLEGFGGNLEKIFSSGILDSLIGKRTTAVEGQLSAGGLTRSGEGVRQIADIPTELGFDLEQLLFGRSQGLAKQGLGAGLDLGRIGQKNASQIGDFRQQGSLADSQQKSGNIDQIVQVAATVLPLIFSDPKLKENIEEVGDINGLPVYQWDWIPAAVGTIVEKCPTVGFMADEVKEVYPEFVKKFGGFNIIDYFGLLDHMEAENNLLQEAA